jgi:hypothetical protein
MNIREGRDDLLLEIAVFTYGPRASDAWFHRHDVLHPNIVKLQFRLVDSAWPHQTHLSQKHVDKLGHLIQAGEKEGVLHRLFAALRRPGRRIGPRGAKNAPVFPTYSGAECIGVKSLAVKP